MELAASFQRYEDAVKKLFPQGAYWDAQFADSQSDPSLFCKAAAAEILRFRSRMDALRNESLPATATEMIDDWERVLLGEVSTSLPILQRRELLNAHQPFINRREIKLIGGKYNVAVFDINFPRSSSAFPLVHAYLDGVPLSVAKTIVAQMLAGALFGSTKCGADRLAVFSAEYALYRFIETGVCLPFEMEVQSKILANQIAGFRYYVRWDEGMPTTQPPASSYQYYGTGRFIGDLTYDTKEFEGMPALPAQQPPASSLPYYGTGCFIGDLTYDTKEFV